MSGLRCEWTIDKFEAYAWVTGDRSGPFVVVKGEGICPTTGYTVHLEELVNEGDTLKLRIVEDAPDGIVAMKVTDTPITRFQTVSAAKHVDIEGIGTIRVSQPYD